MLLKNLDISSISKKSQSSYGKVSLSLLKLKNDLNNQKKYYLRTIHIHMETHDTYLNNLLYLLGNENLKYCKSLLRFLFFISIPLWIYI